MLGSAFPGKSQWGKRKGGEQNYGGELPIFLHFVSSIISPSLRGRMKEGISVHLEARKGEMISHSPIYIVTGLLHERFTYPSSTQIHTLPGCAPMTSPVSETVRKPQGQRQSVPWEHQAMLVHSKPVVEIIQNLREREILDPTKWFLDIRGIRHSSPDHPLYFFFPDPSTQGWHAYSL